MSYTYDDRKDLIERASWQRRAEKAEARVKELKSQRDPQTIPELQAAIGRLQSKLHFMVLGDPRIGVGAQAALTPVERTDEEGKQ